MKRTAFVDAIVIDRLAAVANDERLRQMALEEAESILGQELSPQEKEQNQLKAELSKLYSRFDDWAELLDSGAIDRDQFALRNRQLLDRKQAIQERIGQLDLELKRREDVKVELAGLQAALADFTRLWEHGTLGERKEIVRLLVEKLEITRDSVTIKVKYRPEEVVPLPSMRGKGRTETARQHFIASI